MPKPPVCLDATSLVVCSAGCDDGRIGSTHFFLATPTVLKVIDTYGIELIHPIREGHSPEQIGRKGLSNHRWIVGGKLCLLLNQWGLIVAWKCATANVPDKTFQWLIRQFEERMRLMLDSRVVDVRML